MFNCIILGPMVSYTLYYILCYNRFSVAEKH